VNGEALELLDDHTQLEQAKLSRLRAEIQKGKVAAAGIMDGQHRRLKQEAQHQQRSARDAVTRRREARIPT